MKKFLLIPLIAAVSLITKAQTGARAVTFTENKGQVADENGTPLPHILFTAELGGAKAFITRKGIHYVFDTTQPDGQTSTYRLDMKWLGAAAEGPVTKLNPAAGHQNFYLPQCPQGIFGARSYESVLLEEVYPNIDVLLYGKDGFFEYDFRVKPGGRYTDIKIEYTGTKTIQLLDNGDLEVLTPFATLTEKAPVAFQNGKKLWSAFVSDHSGYTMGFAIGEGYDPNKLLVIDPVIKIWGTYYGGTQVDAATSLYTDNQGNVYLGGNTQSDNVIAMNGHQNTRRGGEDVFIAKFDKNGTRLWATYYGGENTDRLTKIFPFGQTGFYICGNTYSDSAIATSSVHQTEKGGKGDPTDQDAFVARFDSSGVLFWASYFGGYDEEIAYGGATDVQGNVYISGSTTSPTGIGQNGFQNSYNDASLPDAFLAKFDKNGFLQWGTYYGALFSHDYGIVATGTAGEVYLAGFTESDTIMAEGGYDTVYAGDKDIYIAKFDGNGNRIWSSYFGGPGYENLKDITLDIDGNICITGSTQSTTGIAAGGYRTTLLSGSDMYVAKFDSAGTPLWSTYYGGMDIDEPNSVFTDNKKNVYVSGVAESDIGISYRQQGNALNGASDAFVVKFSETGTLDWGVYVGGDADDSGYGTMDADGLIYLAGTTTSSSSISLKGHQSVKSGGTDGYLIKFSPASAKPLPLQPSNVCEGAPFKVNFEVIADLDTNNTFSLQISDKNGDFLSPQTISQKKVSAKGPDSLNFILPANSGASPLYRARLISTHPVDTLITTNFTMKEKPGAVISVPVTSQCLKGNVFNLTDSSKGVINQWAWDFGNGFGSQFQHPVAVYTQPGNFTVQLQVTATNGCSDTASTMVNVLPMPVSGFRTNNNQQCLKGNNFIFTDTSKGNIIEYRWDFGDTTFSSSRNSTKKYNTDGTFVVWHTVTEANLCKDSTATIIRVYPQPNTSAISGDSVVLGKSTHSYQVSATGTFYNWFVENGTLQSGNGTPQITIEWGNTSSGVIKVLETTVFGCIGDTVYLNININPVSVGEIGNTTIKLYPNPVQNYFSIDAQGVRLEKVICYDILGKEIVPVTSDNLTYDISNLSNGVYVVEVITKTGEKWTTRIIKQ